MEFKEQVYFVMPAVFNDDLLYDPGKTMYGIIKNYLPENVGIKVYGIPGTCSWNGGRLMIKEMHTIEKIEGYFASLIFNFGIDIQLTMTNSLLKKEDTYDRYGNALLGLAEKYCNNVEVLVSSPILEEYIREKYPKIRIARSITNLVHPTEEDCERYSTVVLPFSKNEDFEYIKRLAKTGVELEMSITEGCLRDCPFRSEHYKITDMNQLYECKGNQPECLATRPTFPTDKELLPKYAAMGVRNFKIIDRCHLGTAIENIVDYLIDDNDKRTIRNNLYLSLKDELAWGNQDFYTGNFTMLVDLAKALQQYK